MRAMRKEARDLLSWCLEQRGPFTRTECAKAMDLSVPAVVLQFNRLETLGYLECETNYANRKSYMVKDRIRAEEAAQQEAKKAYWLEAQRRLRLKQSAPRKIVNSVWAL